MNTEEAKKILQQSFADLHTRKHKVYLQDVEEEVIQNTCLSILKNNQVKHAADYAVYFTNACMELVSIYTEKEASVAIHDIQKHVQWDGMWDELKKYFQETHNLDIGDEPNS